MPVTPQLPPNSYEGFWSILGSVPTIQPSITLPFGAPLVGPLAVFLFRDRDRADCFGRVAVIPSYSLLASDWRVRRVVPGVSTNPSGMVDLLSEHVSKRGGMTIGDKSETYCGVFPVWLRVMRSVMLRNAVNGMGLWKPVNANGLCVSRERCDFAASRTRVCDSGGQRVEEDTRCSAHSAQAHSSCVDGTVEMKVTIGEHNLITLLPSYQSGKISTSRLSSPFLALHLEVTDTYLLQCDPGLLRRRDHVK